MDGTDIGALTAGVFDTSIGAMAVVRSERGLVRIGIGFASTDAARSMVEERFPAATIVDRDPLEDRLVDYAEGRPVDFSGGVLDEAAVFGGPAGGFRRRVIDACRRVPPGETRSYRELAEEVGSPRSARAVGGVMARNAWPIVVPCHRVCRSDGSLGGFTAPGGLDLKRRLLRLESEGVCLV